MSFLNFTLLYCDNKLTLLQIASNHIFHKKTNILKLIVTIELTKIKLLLIWFSFQFVDMRTRNLLLTLFLQTKNT